jgi:hypothetical protein
MLAKKYCTKLNNIGLAIYFFFCTLSDHAPRAVFKMLSVLSDDIDTPD